MQEEYYSLIKNGTWELITLPPGKNLIQSKWALKTKRDDFGELYRYKSRLVGRGCTQVQGLDCGKTFAPVGNKSFLGFFLACSLENNMVLGQANFDTACLYAVLDEEIYKENLKVLTWNLE